MVEELDELLDKARRAQRAYDTAKEAKDKEANPNPKPDEGTIIATSTEKGFTWNCRADAKSIVRHTIRTIGTAFTSLNSQEGTELHKLLLATGIMEELSKVAENERVK